MCSLSSTGSWGGAKTRDKRREAGLAAAATMPRPGPASPGCVLVCAVPGVIVLFVRLHYVVRAVMSWNGVVLDQDEVSDLLSVVKVQCC